MAQYWLQIVAHFAVLINTHSDRGSQYVSIRYSERLSEAGIEPSVGSRGNSYDNAMAETSTSRTGEVDGAYLQAVRLHLEKTKAQIRARVGHPFPVIKRQLGYFKVRYRGLAENTA